MYMMYPSHPLALKGDQFYVEPALGNAVAPVIPQYLEPKLAGIGTDVTTFAFPAVGLAAGIGMMVKGKGITKKLGIALTAVGAISALKMAHDRGVI